LIEQGLTSAPTQYRLYGRPVKPVGRITYIVLVQTLNPAQSINH